MMKYADNEQGHIQCVINSKFKDEFLALGFVDHIDKVEKPIKKIVKRRRRTGNGD